MGGVLFSTSICFDLSVYELYVTLGCGGKVIMAENALYLPTLPARDEVTQINTVPSAIAELVNMNAIPASVRTITLCGEPLKNVVVQKLYALPTIERVYNLYGPTEDTVYSTVALMERGAEGVPTIGRPITNTQIYIVDKQMQPVPIGVPGELLLGGDGLAREYLHRQELTDEKFIPNPFVREKGARVYRTGDLVRYLPNGNIDFHGRIDHQVKIRGFRMELGEIEAALSKHRGVREVVVMAREDESGSKYLAAYLSANPGAELTVSDLRAYLKDRLPEYMVPSSFVMLDALPLTPNGKIDRKALPEPDMSLANQGRAYAPPRTPMEKLVAAVWANVLKQDRISVTDNFFDIGGHSLLVVKVHQQLQEKTERTFPLVDMYKFTTAQGIAGYLSQGNDDEEKKASRERQAQRAGQKREAMNRQKELRKKGRR
jgi:acyl-coenzyme A synthetase/AMP-(fatty) acid ligase